MLRRGLGAHIVLPMAAVGMTMQITLAPAAGAEPGAAADLGLSLGRASVSSAGAEGDADSGLDADWSRWGGAVNGNGRYVVFTSAATNLVPGDTNGATDVFLRDRWTRKTERVSVSGTGAEGNGRSFEPSVSADGRYVAFTSQASNLVAGDANGTFDVFLKDRWTGATTNLHVDSDEDQGNSAAFSPSVSADGRYVAFSSGSVNLVPGVDNGYRHIFLRDVTAGTTEAMSLNTAGEPLGDSSSEPSISADGRYVAFTSNASNAVPGDTNDTYDVFVRDRTAMTTTRVSLTASGGQFSGSGAPSISADGRYVAFGAGSDDGTSHVYRRDLQSGTTQQVSAGAGGASGNGDSGWPSISASGRFVTYESRATNLTPDEDTNEKIDVFVTDLLAQATTRVSVSSAGEQGDGRSEAMGISGDGRTVLFGSAASNLVAGDTNGFGDAFVSTRA
ncbi:TolB family protein [Actinomadura luteofluorescens]|uniref:TolB family protein n=1 Tax=Actinomadura luteofluorescens TaxID=46163 RepID=UPI003498098E